VGDAVNTVTDEKSSTATFSFGSSLPRGKGRLCIAYTGELNNQMCGFYRSTYTNVHGEEKLMASTQFESIDARRCSSLRVQVLSPLSPHPAWLLV
jgi:puromycin-sensitive aminopeptidase